MDTSQKPVQQPTQPAQPAQPASPLIPSVQPAQSIKPTLPTQPAQSTLPAQQIKLNQSTKPIQPAPLQPKQKFLPLYKPALHIQNRHNFLIALGIGLSIITVLIAFFLARQRVSFFSSARTPSSQVMISKENSYIFASPISAFADGISIIRVTVFMLSNQGLGVSGQTVKLKTSAPLTVNQVKSATDDYGRAIFDVTANTPGTYTLSAETGDLTLSQKVSISFQ